MSRVTNMQLRWATNNNTKSTTGNSIPHHENFTTQTHIKKLPLAFTFDFLESRLWVSLSFLQPRGNLPNPMSESTMSPKPSISIAFALMNSPQNNTESAARETRQQLSTTPLGIEAIVEGLETRGVKLREEIEKVMALVAEKEEQVRQLMQEKELAQEQAEKLQEQRNHLLMLLVGGCAGLFFVIFGHS